MSRVTKYLRQKCTYEKLKRDTSGNALLDKFGDPQYESPVVIPCRREQLIQEVQTNTGAILKSTTRYITDDRYSIQANDKLDCNCVLKTQEYVNQFGRVEGYESYV